MASPREARYERATLATRYNGATRLAETEGQEEGQQQEYHRDDVHQSLPETALTSAAPAASPVTP